MSQNYYDATGTLVLDKVTPVIKALFGAFNLDASYPGDGEVYIATISEDNDPNWDCIRESLAELAEEMGLTPTKTVDDGHGGWIHALCAHFGDKDDELVSEIASFQDSAWVGDVFAIAQELDDGHGLKAIKFEGSSHSSKARLGEFGGDGQYISKDCYVGVSSGHAIEFGTALQTALDGGNLDNVADVVFVQVGKVLGSIQDEVTRNTVKQKLAVMLAAATGQEGC